ncbi:MAG: ATP-dependent DNA helicase RecG [Firmicutes bacterium]|nr:ATP-dependent DNA helicase RecG [Bacillota bacterium]
MGSKEKNTAGLKSPVTVLPGLGPKKAEALERLKIRTIEDFLCFYPRDYEDRRSISSIMDLREGEPSLVRAVLRQVRKGPYVPRKKRLLRLLVEDQSGVMEVLFFNALWLEKNLKPGETYLLFGTMTVRAGKRQMVHPEMSRWTGEEERGILPIYPLTAGISQNEMRKWQRAAALFYKEAEEYMPSGVLAENRLCGLDYALENIHFPKDIQKLKEARYRLVFEELFLLQTSLLALRNRVTQEAAGIPFSSRVKLSDFGKTLPFPLTGAQKRVMAEIDRDMESPGVMNRLVQGDVGSGKTAVAAAAVYKAVKSGYQAVLMAPTEILARQHFESLGDQFRDLGFQVDFLSGSMSAKERQIVLTELASGRTDFLIGTHAVIQPGVEFARLGLAITDEQHRFGVRQRGLLSQKGCRPDTLVMTATPIPRTLAFILYGDLDISIIDEMPPGRLPIVTKSVEESQRDLVYDFLAKEVEKGRQAYVVAPLIEDSEALEETRSAASLFEEVSKRFPEKKAALLHGEMTQKEKDRIMEAFYNNEVQIRVSTVVIEVGINVPNATIMVIENAERFGLAQLHQLRGRVGRGSHQSYCVLITAGNTPVAKERAAIMAETSDGFRIAEKDLELRGPGELFGTRQHGLPQLKIADLCRHGKVLSAVSAAAKKILSEDPRLEKPENQGLRQKIEKTFEKLEDFG